MLSAALIFLVVGAAATVLAAPHIHGYRDDPFVVETSTVGNQQQQVRNETLSATDEYDQRQNGSENYRINVKGVVVLLAPAETILAAANLPNLEGELGSFKPPKATTEVPVPLDHAPEIDSSPGEGCEGGKCNSSNATVKQRGKLKMMSNILQLFRNLNEDVAHV